MIGLRLVVRFRPVVREGKKHVKDRRGRRPRRPAKHRSSGIRYAAHPRCVILRSRDGDEGSFRASRMIGLRLVVRFRTVVREGKKHVKDRRGCRPRPPAKHRSSGIRYAAPPLCHPEKPERRRRIFSRFAHDRITPCSASPDDSARRCGSRSALQVFCGRNPDARSKTRSLRRACGR